MIFGKICENMKNLPFVLPFLQICGKILMDVKKGLKYQI